MRVLRPVSPGAGSLQQGAQKVRGAEKPFREPAGILCLAVFTWCWPCWPRLTLLGVGGAWEAVGVELDEEAGEKGNSKKEVEAVEEAVEGVLLASDAKQCGRGPGALC